MRAGRQRRERHRNRAVKRIVCVNATAGRCTDADGICRSSIRQRGGNTCRTCRTMEQNALWRRTVHCSRNQRARGDLANKQVGGICKKEVAEPVKRDTESVRATERPTRRRQLANVTSINVEEEDECVVADVNIPEGVGRNLESRRVDRGIPAQLRGDRRAAGAAAGDRVNRTHHRRCHSRVVYGDHVRHLRAAHVDDSQPSGRNVTDENVAIGVNGDSLDCRGTRTVER